MHGIDQLLFNLYLYFSSKSHHSHQVLWAAIDLMVVMQQINGKIMIVVCEDDNLQHKSCSNSFN